MTVENPDRVDSITESADGGSVTLLMVEQRRLDGSEAQCRQLMEKVNGYLTYLQLGQLYTDYPQARGKPLRVRLVCRDSPEDERYREVLRRAAGAFRKLDAEFSVEVIPDQLLGPTVH